MYIYIYLGFTKDLKPQVSWPKFVTVFLFWAVGRVYIFGQDEFYVKLATGLQTLSMRKWKIRPSLFDTDLVQQHIRK